MAWILFKPAKIHRLRTDKAQEVQAIVVALEKAGPGHVAKTTLAPATVRRYTDRLEVKLINSGTDKWNSRVWLKAVFNAK